MKIGVLGSGDVAKALAGGFVKHGLKSCSVRATPPRPVGQPRPPPERTTNSHNHIKVVAVFEWRLDNHQAACRAHGVRVGSTGATNVCKSRDALTPSLLLLR